MMMMRIINWTSKFKRDYKRESKTHGQTELDGMLDACFDFLLFDLPLPSQYKDHILTGRWNNHRECHLKPDLLLIYLKLNDDALTLSRLGSHSELYGK
jgi:mRNA interferase YafQ